jgi:membrane fusion protein (multidrug efflux system)
VQLASPAEGPVISLRARQGDEVRIGDTLVEIGRQAGTSALIASLKEQLAKDEDSYRRAKELALIDGISTQQLDLARSTFESSRAQLVKAEESASDFSVLAPWNGVVSDLKAEVGDYVSPRAPLLEMYDPASLILRAEIPERYAPNLRKGMKISVTLDAYPDSLFAAIITRVYPYLDERMRTRTIEATVADPKILLPGMFARLSIKIGMVQEAIVVPNQALTITPSGETIAFLLIDGAAKRQKVKTGVEDAGRVQILAGVQLGDTLITSGVMSLKDGMKVTPIVSSIPSGEQPDAAKKSSAERTSSPVGGKE